MRYVKLLFKKDIIEKFSKENRKRDILGFFTSLILSIIIYGVFVYVFSKFAKIYLETDFGDVSFRKDRLKEFFTVCFSVVLIVNVIVGIKNINNVFIEAKDNDVLIYQPITSGAIFIYKLLKVYIFQFISTLFIIIPVIIIIDMNCVLIGGVNYYFLAFLSILLFPLIITSIAVILSILYMKLMKNISSKFIVLLFIYIVVMAASFLVYSWFLKMLSDLVRSGALKYVFELDTINFISEITTYLYPSKFFTNILLGDNVFLNMLIVFFISGLAVMLSYFILKKIYIKNIQDRLEGNGKVYKNNIKLKMNSPTRSLLYKEFVVVLRTPTYAFSYFAMAVVMPFMVYTCSILLESMLATLTVINCNYALSIFVVSMFSILTNNFCITNISRDGKMFALLKTLPVTVHKIVGVKLLFCSFVSFVSVLVSSLVLLVTDFLNFRYFVITFIIGFLFSLVQIGYGTRKDMKNPCFFNNQEEIVEGNNNMSTLILFGLLSTMIAGGGSVLVSVVIGMRYNEKLAALFSIGFVFVITIVALVIVGIYLFRKLEKEYYSMEW